MVHAVVQKQRAEAEARMPISKADLRALFDYLDDALPTHGCDRSLRLTTSFLQSRALNPASVLPWLGEYGGFCDCEVLANVEDAWQE